MVYLLTVEPLENSSGITNGFSAKSSGHDTGLRFLRTAEVVQVLDEKGHPIRETLDPNGHDFQWRPRFRRLLVNIDADAYKTDNDCKAEGTPDVYESINLIVRRRGRENNFKKILETIRSLALADIPAPTWLQEVFLGYGDPSGATYTRLENRLKSLDLRDTFLDWQHLIESLPGKVRISNLQSYLRLTIEIGGEARRRSK